MPFKTTNNNSAVTFLSFNAQLTDYQRLIYTRIDYNLISVTIPSSVSTIGYFAFAWCYSLKEITLPDGLTVIDGGTFYDCRSLTKITIPSSVTRIGAELDDEEGATDGPFAYCPLETLIVPASVQTIGQAGLWTTENTIIIMESTTPPSSIHDMALEDAMGSRVFSKIIVPNGSKDAYQNANVWKKYKNLIFEQGEFSEEPVTITMNTGKTWMAYSSNANLDFTNVEGVKAYIAAGYVETIVWMMRVNVVPANTGIVLISDTPGATFEVPTTTRTGIYANYFVPIVSRQTIYPTQEIDGVDYTYFVVGTLSSTGKPGFVYVPSEMQYGPNRSVVKIPTASIPGNALSRGMTAVFDDGTTFIDDLTIKEDDDDLEWYTLSGVRIHKPTKKGIYLHKGKKVLIK